MEKLKREAGKPVEMKDADAEIVEFMKEHARLVNLVKDSDLSNEKVNEFNAELVKVFTSIHNAKDPKLKISSTEIASARLKKIEKEINQVVGHENNETKSTPEQLLGQLTDYEKVNEKRYKQLGDQLTAQEKNIEGLKKIIEELAKKISIPEQQEEGEGVDKEAERRRKEDIVAVSELEKTGISHKVSAQYKALNRSNGWKNPELKEEADKLAKRLDEMKKGFKEGDKSYDPYDPDNSAEYLRLVKKLQGLIDVNNTQEQEEKQKDEPESEQILEQQETIKNIEERATSAQQVIDELLLIRVDRDYFTEEIKRALEKFQNKENVSEIDVQIADNEFNRIESSAKLAAEGESGQQESDEETEQGQELEKSEEFKKIEEELHVGEKGVWNSLDATKNYPSIIIKRVEYDEENDNYTVVAEGGRDETHISLEKWRKEYIDEKKYAFFEDLTEEAEETPEQKESVTNLEARIKEARKKYMDEEVRADNAENIRKAADEYHALIEEYKIAKAAEKIENSARAEEIDKEQLRFLKNQARELYEDRLQAKSQNLGMIEKIGGGMHWLIEKYKKLPRSVKLASSVALLGVGTAVAVSGAGAAAAGAVGLGVWTKRILGSGAAGTGMFNLFEERAKIAHERSVEKELKEANTKEKLEVAITQYDRETIEKGKKSQIWGRMRRWGYGIGTGAAVMFGGKLFAHAFDTYGDQVAEGFDKAKDYVESGVGKVKDVAGDIFENEGVSSGEGVVNEEMLNKLSQENTYQFPQSVVPEDNLEISADAQNIMANSQEFLSSVNPDGTFMSTPLMSGENVEGRITSMIIDNPELQVATMENPNYSNVMGSFPEEARAHALTNEVLAKHPNFDFTKTPEDAVIKFDMSGYPNDIRIKDILGPSGESILDAPQFQKDFNIPEPVTPAQPIAVEPMAERSDIFPKNPFDYQAEPVEPTSPDSSIQEPIVQENVQEAFSESDPGTVVIESGPYEGLTQYEADWSKSIWGPNHPKYYEAVKDTSVKDYLDLLNDSSGELNGRLPLTSHDDGGQFEKDGRMVLAREIKKARDIAMSGNLFSNVDNLKVKDFIPIHLKSIF